MPEEGLLGVGLYTAPEAARLLTFEVGAPIKSKKVRRWLKGYSYKAGDVIRESAPIIGHRLADTSEDLFTFAELIELLVVGAFRHHGVSSNVIRETRKCAEEMFGPNPFSRRKFDTNGREIFVSLTRADLGEDIAEEQLTVEVIRGQGALDAIVRPLFHKIDFVDEVAGRFWPIDHDHDVVIDPERQFGRAIETVSGIPTDILYGMHKAGETIEAVASWYGAPLKGVRDAVKYEAALNKAA